MASVLVVCTGNVCRSPSAEGLLRRAIDDRVGAGAIAVTSAGTAGWEGSPATEGSIEATAERGVDIATHRARQLTAEQIAGADLVIAMAREHRDAVQRLDPGAAARTFTLKELVRLVDGTTSEGPAALAAAADARRSTVGANPHDEDVADPLGMPIETYRAMAWELDELSTRLAAAFAPTSRREAS
jgi:protein-tyrosine phosphatase